MIKATATNDLFRRIGEPPRAPNHWTKIRGDDVLEAHKLRTAKLTKSKIKGGEEYQQLTEQGEKVWDCMFKLVDDQPGAA